MKQNPENYCMRLVGSSVPTMESSLAEREAMVKKILSESLAMSILKMDRFIEAGLSENGDEQTVLELFVFTREELNMFMAGVAEDTAQYLMGGSKRN